MPGVISYGAAADPDIQRYAAPMDEPYAPEVSNCWRCEYASFSPDGHWNMCAERGWFHEDEMTDLTDCCDYRSAD